MKQGETKTVYIATFGCQMNTYDSGRMLALLGGMGYEEVLSPRRADLILVNTCSVRERAEQKVYSLLGSMRGYKKAKKGVIIGVTGCVAQQEGEKLLKKIPHLDMVVGTRALDRLPELIRDAQKGKRRSLTPKGGDIVCLDAPPLKTAPLKASITVMQGCDNFCSYCVVPYVRGREQSRPAEEVVQEARELVAAGSREILLLGQNVNSYHDPGRGLDFARLLKAVSDIEGLWRLRFTTSHPKDLSPSLIDALAELPKVMEQLHLPAQSGSDRILKAMNRGYSRKQYLGRVEALRKKVPDLALGGDMIVGFPGESEEDFRQSLSLLDEVGYDFLYSFIYSDRPFTKASRLSDKLPRKAAAERLNLLQEKQRGISLALHQGLIGRTLEVLVEGPAKKGEGLMTGRSRAGRAVNFLGPDSLAGELVEVVIEQGRINSLMGRLAEPAKGGAA